MKRSSAQTYALIVGATFTVAGIVGFLYTGDFSTGHATSLPGHHRAVLGILNVNGWHNAVHLATGLLGLAAARSLRAARAYALVLGLGYTAVTIAGLVVGSGNAAFGLIPVNAEDDVLHAIVAFAGLAIWFAGSPTPAPTPRTHEQRPGFRFD